MADGAVRSLAAACLASLLLTVDPAVAAPVPLSERIERREPAPKQLQGVDVLEHLGEQVPLALPFRDQNGRRVTLGQYFDGRHPVLLTLNYSNCPMLCSLMLTGLVKGLKGVEWGINQDFQVVTVSLDAAETLDVAQRTADRYLTQYGRPEARGGWHFLTGSEASIRAYADALGFSYRYDEKRKEFAHPAALALASPSGTLVRYLYGLEFEPRTLRLGLVEASEGKIGTTLDRLVLYCFHYDSSEGRYAPVARRIMEMGGAATVLLLGGFLWVLSRAESKRRRRLAESTVT